MIRIRRKPKPKRWSIVLTLTQLILEKLLEFGEVTLDAFFPAKYPEARLWREILGLDPAYEFSPRSFSAILCRLRKQGLVARRGKRRRSYWSLSAKGKLTLEGIEPKSNPLAHLPPLDKIPRLVIFDIPERERKKRDAIRQELLACDFRQLQKSVWLGYRPLPEDFFGLLDEFNLKKCVHILTVRDTGTIEDK